MNYLCELRMKLRKVNKAEPWDKDNLFEVLKQLRNEK